MSAAVMPTFSKVKPTMFFNKICPFVHRAWIAAVEKNVDFDYCYISLGDDYPKWYTEKINPAETVPALLLPDGQIIRESLLVAQYIDETYGLKGSLQSGSSLQRFQTRRFVKACGEGVIGAMYGLLMSSEPDKNDAKEKEISQGLARLEKLYAVSQGDSGPYFLGETFSMADIAILPFLDRFRHTLSAFRDFDILNPAELPRLSRMLRAAESRPSFALTAQPADFYVNGYKGYAKTAPVQKAYQAKLYVADNCPFCQRVKLANALKGFPCELVEVPLPAPEWYTKKVPSETVPAIELADGTILEESLELTQFVDEFSTNIKAIALKEGDTIQPTDAVAAYETRFLLSEFGETMGDLWAAKSGDAEKGAEVLTKLGFLESYYARQKNGGPYFLGEKATLADCALLPFWATTEVLFEVHLAKLPAAGGKTFGQAFPRISASIAAARAEEAFKGILPSKDSLTEGMTKKA